MTNVETFTLKNKHSIEAKIISLGATLVSLKTPDKNGKFADVVLGYDNAEDYLKDKCYFGCTIGRFANRIANARFSIDGKEYKLVAFANQFKGQGTNRPDYKYDESKVSIT